MTTPRWTLLSVTTLVALLAITPGAMAQGTVNLQERRAAMRQWNQLQQSRLLEQMRCVDQAGSSQALERCQQRFHEAMPGHHGAGGCWR